MESWELLATSMTPEEPLDATGGDSAGDVEGGTS
jgi:hypothetical protein